MISRLLKKFRLALCALGLATPNKDPINTNTTVETKNPKISIKYKDFRLGALVHLNSSEPSDKIPNLNITREFRRNLKKEMMQAQRMKERIRKTKEHYDLCKHKFGYKLGKTGEFLDTYYKRMNDTYNAIYHILHGQMNQISKAELGIALQGMNETLKRQACEELSRFPIYPDRRLPSQNEER